MRSAGGSADSLVTCGEHVANTLVCERSHETLEQRWPVRSGHSAKDKVDVSKNASLGLIAAGVALVLIALVEHFTVTIELVPHLAIILIVIALILGAVGTWGFMGQRAR